ISAMNLPCRRTRPGTYAGAPGTETTLASGATPSAQAKGMPNSCSETQKVSHSTSGRASASASFSPAKRRARSASSRSTRAGRDANSALAIFIVRTSCQSRIAVPVEVVTDQRAKPTAADLFRAGEDRFGRNVGQHARKPKQARARLAHSPLPAKHDRQRKVRQGEVSLPLDGAVEELFCLAPPLRFQLHQGGEKERCWSARVIAQQLAADCSGPGQLSTVGQALGFGEHGAQLGVATGEGSPPSEAARLASVRTGVAQRRIGRG